MDKKALVAREQNRRARERRASERLTGAGTSLATAFSAGALFGVMPDLESIGGVPTQLAAGVVAAGLGFRKRGQKYLGDVAVGLLCKPVQDYGRKASAALLGG